MTKLSKILSFSSILALLSLGLLMSSANAETITIGLGKQGLSSVKMPERGATRESVENAFGEPNSVTPPIGTPPITTWHYPNFSVYFEENYVIHAVKRHTPNVTPNESAK